MIKSPTWPILLAVDAWQWERCLDWCIALRSSSNSSSYFSLYISSHSLSYWSQLRSSIWGQSTRKVDKLGLISIFLIGSLDAVYFWFSWRVYYSRVKTLISNGSYLSSVSEPEFATLFWAGMSKKPISHKFHGQKETRRHHKQLFQNQATFKMLQTQWDWKPLMLKLHVIL